MCPGWVHSPLHTHTHPEDCWRPLRSLPHLSGLHQKTQVVKESLKKQPSSENSSRKRPGFGNWATHRPCRNTPADPRKIAAARSGTLSPADPGDLRGASSQRRRSRPRRGPARGRPPKPALSRLARKNWNFRPKVEFSWARPIQYCWPEHAEFPLATGFWLPKFKVPKTTFRWPRS